MDREFLLTTLDYRSLGSHDRDFAIQNLRDALLRVVERLAEGSYNFLPEPVDLLTLSNHEDPMDLELRAQEPAVVLTTVSGAAVRPAMDPNSRQIHVPRLKGVVIAALKSLRSLHRNRSVIQQFQMASVRFNAVTYQVGFTGVYALMRMDDFIGFNERRTTLSPDPRFAAPEVLDPKGRLTPATDIYAVGKLALQLLLGNRYRQHFTRENPFPSGIQNVINSLNLPAPWPPFLSTCLQRDPGQRFQTATEAEVFLLPEGRRAQGRPEPSTGAGGHATEAQRTRIDPEPFTVLPERASDTGRPREPWVYRENPELPDGMLLVWGDRLCARGEQVDYVRLYHDFMYKLNLKPRFFFVTQRSGSATANPFFKFLRLRLRLEVIELDGREDPAVVLRRTIESHIQGTRNLVLVGGADEIGVQCVLQLPEASRWQIHWVRAGGQWTPDLPIHNEVDVAKYIRAKRE